MRHELSLKRALPSRDTTLGSTHNKKQLIEILSDYLSQETVKLKMLKKLFITSADPTPKLIQNGNVVDVPELRTTHEEADSIIVQQCFKAIAFGCTTVKVVSDDTDVFVLLAYFYNSLQSKADILMENTSGSRLIDIRKTVEKHKKIIDVLPASHALTGSDSTCRLHGIGKKLQSKQWQ